MAQFDPCAHTVEIQLLVFLLEIYPELKGTKSCTSILELEGVSPGKGSQQQLSILTNTPLSNIYIKYIYQIDISNTPLSAPSCSQQILKCNPLKSHQITPCALKWFKSQQ